MSSINESPAQSPAPPQKDDGYPEQRHAGAVGYGPEYAKGATTGDKITGYKEQLKGKMLHKPDLVEHGREMRTGELKKKQMDNDDMNPFGTVKADDSDAPSSGDAGVQRQASGASGAQSPSASPAQGQQSRAGQPSESFPPDPAHPTEKGAREQAAATAPEGTEKAQRQKSMGNADGVSYIG